VIAIETLTLTTSTPCACRRPVRITALVDIPLERYERTCSSCGAVWTIERRFAGLRDGARIDLLEWTCTRGAA
jgi:hypothetical protein